MEFRAKGTVFRHVRATGLSIGIFLFVLRLFATDALTTLPEWFETNRVQAHFENHISDDVKGLYQELHPETRAMGARVLTRIFKTVGEGAWWPTAAGETNAAIGTRDLGAELARNAHTNGLRVIAYYRVMSDEFVERVHEALKEEHLPIATINDLQFERGIPVETRVILLPHRNECTEAQRKALKQFESRGGMALNLSELKGWHLTMDKPGLKRQLVTRFAGAKLLIWARGPEAMHAVFYDQVASKTSVVCLVNDFGWFHSERDVPPKFKWRPAPPPCKDVTVELADTGKTILRAYEAVTGKPLDVTHDKQTAVIRIPEFPVMACVVVERR